MKGFRIKGISYDDKYSKEQEEIVKRVKKEVDGKNGLEWNKYKGDITAQIIIHYLKEYLSENRKIVGHDYFIYAYKNEWDAMIVKKNAEAYFNTYNPEDIEVIIEIKESGFYKNGIEKLIQDFRDVKRKYPHIHCVLIIAKCAKLRQLKSFKHVFILSDPITWNIENYNGQWESLINFIKGL